MGKKNEIQPLWSRVMGIFLIVSLITALLWGCSDGKSDGLPPTQAENTASTDTAEPELLDTTAKVVSYIEEMAQAGATEITLFCSEEIYNKLLKVTYKTDRSEVKAIYGLLDQTGLYNYRVVSAGMKQTITISDISFYPGYEILRSVEAGTEESLSSQLEKTLAEARVIADTCRTSDPLETAKNIQRELCERVRYAHMTNTSNADTAIGALISGAADCDGYSDAFYLVGGLAGLEVRYQYGISSQYDSEEHKIVTGNHMWNLLKLDGSWRVVDICWADTEDGINYSWFNIGKDRASRSRTWLEDLSVPLLETTDLSARPETEYSVTSYEELAAAMKQAFEKEQASFTIVFDSNNYNSRQDAFDLLWNYYSGEILYYWDECSRVLTILPEDSGGT